MPNNVAQRRPRRNKIPLLPPVSTPPITMPDAPIGDLAAVVIARIARQRHVSIAHAGVIVQLAGLGPREDAR
jgi:hypothetical protein